MLAGVDLGLIVAGVAAIALGLSGLIGFALSNPDMVLYLIVGVVLSA